MRKDLNSLVNRAKTVANKQKEKLRDQVSSWVAIGMITGTATVMKGLMLANWWPAKKAAMKFFETGQFYKFLPNAVWYSVWETSQTETSENKRNRVVSRMKPGTVFMVIASIPRFPDGLDVQISAPEVVGWISIAGEAQYAPWTHFERCSYLQMTAAHDSDVMHFPEEDED